MNSVYAGSNFHDNLSHYIERSTKLDTAFWSSAEARQALVHAQKALALRPRSSRMHYRVGYLAKQMKLSDLAVKSLRRALELGPTDFRQALMMDLGTLEIERREFVAAESTFVELLARGGDSADVRTALALALMYQGRLPDMMVQVDLVARDENRTEARRGLMVLVTMLNRLGHEQQAHAVQAMIASLPP